jgi:hypothetical protein
MYYTLSTYLVARSATNFPVANYNVIMARTNSLNAHSSQNQEHHLDKAIESLPHIITLTDIRKHHIVVVSIDAATTAFPSVDINLMSFAKRQIHLTFHRLITPEDYTRPDLPHQQTIVNIHLTGHELLHCQIE